MEGACAYDFSTDVNQAYLSREKLVNGMAVLYGGDANTDGTINEHDGIQEWYPNVDKASYFGGDFNLDVQVNNPDMNDVCLGNFGKSEILPE